MSLARVQERIDKNKEAFVRDLETVVRIPSISSSSAHKKDVLACAEFLVQRAKKAGFERAEVCPTAGHPIVVAEWLKAKNAPTVLIYGHYDVQPVDPLDLWTSPPFEPSIRDGRLYARGAVDDKGQVWAHLLACEAWLQETGLPVNVKLLVEGEEEIGSEHLEAFLRKEAKRLAADFVVVSDTAMLDRGRPSICYGLRGLAYFQIDLRGTSTDLHSGSFGGGVKNPLHALCEIVSKLKDPKTGKIQVPGFYDDVRPLGKEERDRIRALPHDEASWRKAIDLPATFGEPDFALLERLWARPTLDLNGIWGGFQGEGAKTVIPAEAHAKLSCRLVPDQTPESVGRKVEAFVRQVAPPEVKIDFKYLHGGLPWVADISHPSFGAAVRAMEKGFGEKVCFIREGGSIPFVRTIADETKKPCLLLGFGLPDENAHAPNEWLDLANYQRGIKSCAYLYDELSRS
ncbi:MAG TPA: dipeptidase [Planctomycetota bacterium]|nr:dipeptidase [Planctomycetota bacterium]